MTTQYNVPIKVLDLSQEWRITNSLQGYRVFTDRSGNLEATCFSRENVPYVGKLVVVKTLNQKAAQTAYDVLKGIEGLLVMPITECDWEEDQERVRKAEMWKSEFERTMKRMKISVMANKLKKIRDAFVSA